MCIELRCGLYISCPGKGGKHFQKRNGNLGTTSRNPCALSHPLSLQRAPLLVWHFSAPQFHLLSRTKCSTELKLLQNTQRLKTDVSAFGSTCYLLEINGCKTSNTTLLLQKFVITDAAQPCFGSSSNKAGSRSGNTAKPTTAKSGKSPTMGNIYRPAKETC